MPVIFTEGDKPIEPSESAIAIDVTGQPKIVDKKPISAAMPDCYVLKLVHEIVSAKDPQAIFETLQGAKASELSSAIRQGACLEKNEQ